MAAAGLSRQWLPLAVVMAGIGVLAATLINAWPALSAMTDGKCAVFAELQRLAGEGAAGVVLWPFRALVRLPAAASAAEFWSALPAALAILVVNYVWVLRSDAAFEEASAEHAEQQASRRRGPRAAVKGNAATPFTLAPDGPPETAILWKNLILVGRYVSLRTLLRLLPLLVVFGVVARRDGGGGVAAFVGAMAMLLAAIAVLLGPQMMRNDLRQDLARLPLLKTWPIRGAAIIRGEVLAPTVVVTAVAWLLLLPAGCLGAGLTQGSREATRRSRRTACRTWPPPSSWRRPSSSRRSSCRTASPCCSRPGWPWAPRARKASTPWGSACCCSGECSSRSSCRSSPGSSWPGHLRCGLPSDRHVLILAPALIVGPSSSWRNAGWPSKGSGASLTGRIRARWKRPSRAVAAAVEYS